MASFEAFYHRAGADAFEPTDAASSPWGERLQHGSPPTALLVRAMCESHPRPDMRVARIASEFLGGIPLATTRVRTRVVRPGKRIEMLEGVLEIDGREAVSARVWRIATKPHGAIPPAAHAPDVPPPLPPAQAQDHFPGIRDWGYGEAIEWRFTRGGFAQLGPAEAWTHVRVPLIAGEPLHALDRLLLVVDSANGVSGELPQRDFLFVPPSLSLAFYRDPEGEWTFMNAITELSDDGLGITRARYADARGYLGAGTQALIVEPR
ncbi:MAG TPA: thioesterase family protein [Candidatus Baltobacteraceae bacterium]|nr:thioesterase family protein [Candidatus Baltobacteraceae bacterium]